jgi:hypothetical protein
MRMGVVTLSRKPGTGTHALMIARATQELLG